MSEKKITPEVVEAAIDAKKKSTSSRRRFLTQAGLAGLGVVAAGHMSASAQTGGGFGTLAAKSPGFGTIFDRDILNFALNLEYLEAEFYVRAAFGTTLDAADITGHGLGSTGRPVTPGNVIGVSETPSGDQVDFGDDAAGDLLRQYAEEIANDEVAHVRLLRSALQSVGSNVVVARPTIDIGPAFDAAGQAAGLGAGFNPYASPTNFLLGAFIFEDVGVTAYSGAISLLTQRGNLSVAGALLGVEAYHASEVRTLLTGLASQDNTLYNTIESISNLRDAADGSGDTDQGIVDSGGNVNIVPTDGNGLIFARSLQQVLNIVYLTTNTLGTTHSGGFFPNGLNGKIR